MKVLISLTNGDYSAPSFERELEVTEEEYNYLLECMAFDRGHTTDPILHVTVLYD